MNYQLVRRMVLGMALVIAWLCSGVLWAMPGTHGNSVSSWDTTRSTVVLSYQHGLLLGGGHSNQAAYHANFTSTSGQLSAQFGLEFLQLNPDVIKHNMFGVDASAVAVFGLPVGKRYDNGLPKAALTFFGGVVPALISNGEYNFVTIPVVMGMGMEINPVKQISIIPWVEVAPSINLDTVINYDNFSSYLEDVDPEELNVETDENNEIVSVDINEKQAVNDILDETVEMDVSLAGRLRGGLSLVIHMGDRWDLQLNGTIAQVGDAFDAKPTIFFGGSLAFAWDEPPSSILPEENRLQNISCEAVEARFKRCGAYRALIENAREEGAAAAAAAESEPCPAEEVTKPDVVPEPIEEPEAVAKPQAPLSPQGVGVAKPTEIGEMDGPGDSNAETPESDGPESNSPAGNAKPMSPPSLNESL